MPATVIWHSCSESVLFFFFLKEENLLKENDRAEEVSRKIGALEERNVRRESEI